MHGHGHFDTGHAGGHLSRAATYTGGRCPLSTPSKTPLQRSMSHPGRPSVSRELQRARAGSGILQLYGE
eukprot:12924458-Prorocentrum_lima.AAC.1